MRGFFHPSGAAMTDETGLIGGIFADPDDWTPRLIYADWLEEHGDPAAEVIRLLHELTSRIDPPHRSFREQKLRRLVKKGAALRPTWTGPLGMQFACLPPAISRWVPLPVSRCASPTRI